MKYVIPFVFGVFLVMACGNNPVGSQHEGSQYAEHSLGWGRELAEKVRDQKLPKGDLFMISCMDVDDEGKQEFGIPWQFYFVDPADTSVALMVAVQYIGNTTTMWEDSMAVSVTELPDYDSAGPWVTAARDTLGAEYDDWEENSLLVVANNDPDLPLVSDVAMLQFVSPDSTRLLNVVIDADDNTPLVILELE